jgi:hypothetical protein
MLNILNELAHLSVWIRQKIIFRENFKIYEIDLIANTVQTLIRWHRCAGYTWCAQVTWVDSV